MTVKLPIDPRTMPDGVVLILNVRFTADEGHAGWPAVEAWLKRDNRELVSVEIQTGTKTIWTEPVAVATLSDTQEEHGWDQHGVSGYEL